MPSGRALIDGAMLVLPNVGPTAARAAAEDDAAESPRDLAADAGVTGVERVACDRVRIGSQLLVAARKSFAHTCRSLFGVET
jgi:hypothetical protein